MHFLYQSSQRFPVAERIASRGVSLPTWVGLTRQDVEYICDSLVKALSD
jgi:dTDP-4-amino-4,6-dideoxygalactose transaminase